MEKVEFSFSLNERQKEEKKERVAKLLKRAQLIAWRKNYPVDDAYIYEHSGRFQDYCDTMEACEQCAGLAFCQQPIKGERMELILDGVLQNVLVSCPHQKKEERLYAHQSYYRQKDLPKEYLLIDVGKLDLSGESKEYKACVMQVMQGLMDPENTKGCYLWGRPGVGKSYLAAGICNYYAKRKISVAFVNAARLIGDLKMMFQDSQAMEQKLRMIKTVSVLVLDDIGGESMSAWSRDEILLPILDARMESRKKTYFTSNYNMQELKEKLALDAGRGQEAMAAERLFERIRSLSCEIFVKGCSRRK